VSVTGGQKAAVKKNFRIPDFLSHQLSADVADPGSAGRMGAGRSDHNRANNFISVHKNSSRAKRIFSIPFL